MDELIEKLEAATEGSRELDAAVAVSVGWTHIEETELRAECWISPDNIGHMAGNHPHYTTSLDAAARLVPEGYSFEIISNGMSGLNAAFVTPDICLPGGQREPGSTPELALCAAALKAREDC